MATKTYPNERAFKIGSTVNFSVAFQRESLGLDSGLIESLKGKRVLDLGCGSTANFVNYLRHYGIEAEGIDVSVPHSSYLVNQKICPRKIPREDETYDLIIAHSFSPFEMGLTPFGSFKKKIESLTGAISFDFEDPAKVARFILEDALRVLRRGGKLVTRPAIDLPTQERYEISREDIKRTQFIDEGLAMYVPLITKFNLPKDYFNFMEQRTIVKKN